MGVKLIVEVMEYAPDTLTYRERYVLLVFAENARDATRLCWPGIEDNPDIIRRLRITSRSQRYAVIKALIDKSALDHVRRGQKGVRAVYGIPRFAPVGNHAQGPEIRDAETTLRVPETGTLNGSQGPGNGFSGSRFSGLRVPESGTPSPQSPQDPSSSPRAREERIIRDAGATEDETTEIIEIIKTRHRPRSLSSYVQTMAERGDLADLLTEVRTERNRSTLKAAVEQAERGPECPHGVRGGETLHPDTCEPWLCALCRLAARKAATT